MDEFICLVCKRPDSNGCGCMSSFSPRRLGAYNTAYLKQLFEQIVDVKNRWPDGREDDAAAWIKKELELRGVTVEYPLALTLSFYRQ